MKPRTLRHSHCKYGHKLTPKNIYVRKDGYAECVKCMKDRVKRYRLRRWIQQQKLT
jgi:hypothetical protein